MWLRMKTMQNWYYFFVLQKNVVFVDEKNNIFFCMQIFVFSFDVACSTSFPGGNLVDGLPPALSTGVVSTWSPLWRKPFEARTLKIDTFKNIWPFKVENKKLVENFKENLAQNWVYCAQKNLFAMLIFGFHICERNQKMKKIAKFWKSTNKRFEVSVYRKWVSRHVSV